MVVETREIEARGYRLLVSRDGSIVLPRKETTYTVVRLGKLSTKTAVFKERVLKPSVTVGGYVEVAFVHERKTYKFFVHRLVAQAFVEGYDPDLTVNHLNGIKTDNRPENLEWVTKGANTEHAWATGLVPLVGSEHPGSKLDELKVLHIRRMLARGVPAKSIAIVSGMSLSLIYNIKDRKCWTHVSEGG